MRSDDDGSASAQHALLVFVVATSVFGVAALARIAAGTMSSFTLPGH